MDRPRLPDLCRFVREAGGDLGHDGADLRKRWSRGAESVKSLAVETINTLQVAPSELTKMDVAAPGDGATDMAVEAVRVALMAVDHDQPGEVLPVEVLRASVLAILDARCRYDRQGEAAVVLPGLIKDLHTSIAAGRDVAELLDLAVLLHTQGTGAWLRVVGGPLDLRRDAARLARQAARDRDTPTA